MIELWLIRHGNKAEGHFYDDQVKAQNCPISRQGRQQAAELARRIAKIPFSAIYASDLLRTRQTASLINSKLKLPLQTVPELREINFGEIEAMTKAEILVKYPDLIVKYYTVEEDLPYPGGETGADVLQRLLPFIRTLLRTDNRRYLLVTHGGIIRIFISYILAMQQGKRFRLGDPPKECSVSIIKYFPEDDRYVLDLFNCTGGITVRLLK